MAAGDTHDGNNFVRDAIETTSNRDVPMMAVIGYAEKPGRGSHELLEHFQGN